jgi:outer membrane protein assembly factor BamB
MAVLFVAMMLPSALVAQIQVRVLGNEFRRMGAIRLDLNRPGAIAESESESEYVDPESGAVLKTDPDLEASLQTAERFKNDGNYRIATQLWQAVLGRSGDSLYSQDRLTYFSLVQQVERILADLPPEGLAAYRVIADAEAKEILAEANDPFDTVALNKVVRLYFISSLGDDAAFTLGCIYLDRFDFIGARRMFEKIEKHYPDPSVPREDILVRIALCQSYLGQTEAAQRLLDVVAEQVGDSRLGSQVRSSLGELNDQKSTNVVESNWSMPLGSSRRYGVMPGVPAEMMESDLVAAWQYYFEPDDSYNVSDTQGDLLVGEGSVGLNDNGTVTVVEEKLIDAWKEKNWRPAGHLLFDDGRVYFKSAADLSVWNVSEIDKMVESAIEEPDVGNAISWRSVWRNAFEIDEATQMIQTIRRSWGGYGNQNGAISVFDHPQSTPEVQLFGDEIYQQMSICDGVVYSIEGNRFDDRNRTRAQRVAPQWNTSFRRTRTNFLTAYDAVTGAVKWTLPRSASESTEGTAVPAAESSDTPFIEGGGFMAAPIEFGDLVLVPVNNGGSISVYALDPEENGKTVWKSFLCDEPESGAEPWSAVTLTVDGSDLFVSSGMGVVFVLDPATGMVRFAKRYERVGTADDFRRRSGWTVNRLNFSGWSYDVVIPYGRQMICFSSDTESITALDRNNGDLIWRTEISPIGYKVDYVLGIYNDILYTAGRETIVAYDLKGEGRMVWGADQMFDGKQSQGRGVLTPQGLYLPVEDSIYHFSLSGEDGGGELLSRVQVRLGTKAPVGNLYSDGSQFWVHGGNRLYVLAPEPD